MKNALTRVLAYTFVISAGMSASIMAFAAEEAPKFADTAFNLYNSIVGKAPVAAIVVAAIQLLKSDLLGGLLLKLDQKWMPVVMLGVSAIGGVAQSMVQGKGLVQGLVDGLITSGLAMSIYTTIKHIKAPTAAPEAPKS